MKNEMLAQCIPVCVCVQCCLPEEARLASITHSHSVVLEGKQKTFSSDSGAGFHYAHAKTWNELLWDQRRAVLDGVALSRGDAPETRTDSIKIHSCLDWTVI